MLQNGGPVPRRMMTGAVRPIPYQVRKKLKNGRTRTYSGYHARIDGKWVSAKTYDECVAKIREKLREKRDWGMGVDRTTTLGAYTDQWLELKEHEVKPKSFQNYKSVTDVHLAKYRDVKLADVTPSAVKRMFRNMRNLDGTEVSVNRKLSFYNVLRQIFAAAVADRIIPTSPITSDLRPRHIERLADRNVKQPAIEQSDKRSDEQSDRRSGEQHRKAFTVDEVRAMLKASADDMFEGTRWWWKLLTGMRQSEILGVVLDDLELHRIPRLERPGGPEVWAGTYTMNWKLEKLNKRHGCGDPDRNGVYPCGFKMPSFCPKGIWVVPDGYDMIPLRHSFALTPPKSQRGSVKPIIPQLGTVVHRYLEATKDMPNPYNLLFRTSRGYPIDERSDMLAFRDLMRRAGIEDPESRYGHECRRSVATFLFDQGVDPGIITRLIGHSGIEMTERYRDVGVDRLMAGMETIGDKLDLKQIEWKTGEQS